MQHLGRKKAGVVDREFDPLCPVWKAKRRADATKKAQEEAFRSMLLGMSNAQLAVLYETANEWQRDAILDAAN
jgi:hypothetical protein